ncbi:MAG: FIST C-terminal domain-containing protein, partial [Myxococcota bacterium]|nr:FIST C-terminal domain-containing protein [Myxococcota bacterium]
ACPFRTTEWDEAFEAGAVKRLEGALGVAAGPAGHETGARLGRSTTRVPGAPARAPRPRFQMTAFAAAVDTSSRGVEAAGTAAARALTELSDAKPVLAVVFASVSYDDLDGIPAAVERELGGVPLVGGTAGGALFERGVVATRGVLVALLGGDGVRATTTTAAISSPELFDVVPAGARLLSAADDAAREGFEESLCLVFAPAAHLDGDALVAAARKGTGARMQLAGALAGDDFSFDRSLVFADGGARRDRAVMAGVFTRLPVGVAARHGWRAAGPVRVVTSSEGPWLVRIDGRRAIDAWVTDVRAAGARPPPGNAELVAFLANSWALGLGMSSPAALSHAPVEPAARAPLVLRDDGAVLLSSPVVEGSRVHVMTASRAEMRRAAIVAAELARQRAGGSLAGGLVFACSARLAALGDGFAEEQASIGQALGARTAGACVFGEIGRAHREVHAFHNMTTTVVAWPANQPAR